MTVIMLEKQTDQKIAIPILLETPQAPEQGIRPIDCPIMNLIDSVSEGYSDEPTTEFQDSCDSAGLYYW